MKFSIHKADLFKALSHVQSIVEKRNTIPILSNILITAKNNRLSLTATDLDIEIVETIDADIQKEGSLTIPAHMFYEIVRKLPENVSIDIDFNEDNERITLDAGRSHFTLPTLPQDDFPLMSSLNEGVEFSIASKDLKLMLDKNKFAMSQEETRYYLNGIYVHPVKEDAEQNVTAQLISVATDGHRLSKISTALPSAAEAMPPVIIPRKTVIELSKLLDNSSESLNVTVTETKIRFFLKDLLLTSKLIDGTFPAYQNVIPSKNDIKLVLNTKNFIHAVDRVTTISNDKIRTVKLILDQNQLTFHVDNPDFGSATEALEIEYNHDRLEIGFNARYLLDVLSQLDTDETELYFGDTNAPVIIKNYHSETALYILMPMRV